MVTRSVLICLLLCFATVWSSPIDSVGAAGVGLWTTHVTKEYAALQSIRASKAKPSEVVSPKCELCRVAIDGFKFFIGRSKLTEECLGALIDYGCTHFAKEGAQVCQGIQSEFRDEVLYIALQIIAEPKEVCSLVLDNCGTPYNPLKGNWSLPVPPGKPPLEPWTQPKANAKTLRIVQLSDIHYDKLYTPGSEADCGQPLCCRTPHPTGTPKVPAGQWATAAACDVPSWTIEAILDHIAHNVSADALYWTGDLNPHNVWNQSRSDQLFDLKKLTGWLSSRFPRDFVFPAVGNHESLPCDSFPTHAAPSRYGSAWLYDALAEQWSTLRSDVDSSTVRYRASYSVKVGGGLRVVSLNTMMGDDLNLWLYDNQTDPDGTLSWLAQQLLQAEAAKEKVHIIGHIPPGPASPGALPGWARNFYALINRFESTVRGQFYGHTHDDHFQIFYDGARYPGRATQVAFIAPSVTTYERHVPSYRLYTVDGDYPGSTYQVLDTETWLLDIEHLNKFNQTRFYLEYSARKDYGMKSLTPADWDQLQKRLNVDKDLFHKYFSHFYHRLPGASLPSLTAERHNAHICDLRSAMPHSEDRFCRDLSPLPPNPDVEIVQASLEKVVADTVQFSWINRIVAACKKAK